MRCWPGLQLLEAREASANTASEHLQARLNDATSRLATSESRCAELQSALVAANATPRAGSVIDLGAVAALLGKRETDFDAQSDVSTVIETVVSELEGRLEVTRGEMQHVLSLVAVKQQEVCRLWSLAKL